MKTVLAGSLVLEPQVAAHAAEMFALLRDPAIYEFENSPPESQAWLERRFTQLESRASADGAQQWLNWVVRLPTGELAGYVQATVGRDRAAHVAYELASRFWRRGIGSTAVGAMLTELAASYDVTAFVATLKAANYRSLAFLRSLGFDEKRPRQLPASGCAADETVMYKALGEDDNPASNDTEARRRSTGTPTNRMDLRIREADFANPADASSIVTVLDSYAADPVGGGQPLSADVRDRVVPALRDHPTTVVLLAFAAQEPVGIAVCFLGLSTFRARPLLNIHDLAVVPQYRGKGVGRALLGAAEQVARGKGCCKLTLEVQDSNARARTLYQSFGFEDFVVGNSSATRFLAKPLATG